MENGFNDRALVEKLNGLVRSQERELARLRDALQEMKTVAEALSHNEATTSDTVSSSRQAPRLLLIEDDELALMGVNGTLSQIPCSVTVAKTVAEAHLVLMQQAFDIIFCDMKLPDGTGLEIIDMVKKDALGPNYHTPFIALTADNDKGRTLIAEQHGFDLYLVKPLTQESAKAVIDVYAFNLNANIGGGVYLGDSQAVIDLEQAKAISGGDKDLALELIGRLIHDFPEERAALVQAYQSNNVDAVRDTLHRLKGGASYCGVPQLKAAIKALHDQVGDIVDLSQIEPAFLRVYRELDAVKRVYESLSH